MSDFFNFVLPLTTYSADFELQSSLVPMSTALGKVFHGCGLCQLLLQNIVGIINIITATCASLDFSSVLQSVCLFHRSQDQSPDL